MENALEGNEYCSPNLPVPSMGVNSESEDITNETKTKTGAPDGDGKGSGQTEEPGDSTMESQEETWPEEDATPSEEQDKPESRKRTAAELMEVKKESLLWGLKKEVKQIMEEAVTRRFIHEESSSVTALGAAVEACLVHGLRRRVLGLFGTTSTFALLHKISKLCPPAASVLRIVIQTQQTEMKERRSVGGSFEKMSRSASLSQKDLPACYRYLWIRIAIFEKLLPTIVDFIVKEAHKYYEKEALMMDSVRACMVASLLVGPCALEYTKMKTADHYWTDPPADELIQRQKLHSRNSIQCPPTSPTPRSPRPTLQVRRSGSIGPEEYSPKAYSTPGARDYVWSLHQNHRTTLLYGKNNVSVCPPDQTNPLKGYLSLHQNSNGTLSIKWTPNELMHSDSEPKYEGAPLQDKNVFWRYAMNLKIDEIVYLHFHQRGETGGSIVLVGADGVQHPPITFPLGQHPLAFLSCLENGLLPWGQLDPPLWLQKGKGKVFPKLHRRSSSLAMSNGKISGDLEGLRKGEKEEKGEWEETRSLEDAISQDFVFRIVPVCRPGRLTEELSIRGPPSLPSNSKLVNLTSFSSRLKERFLSIGSSPASSPPTTPKSRTSSGNSQDAETESNNSEGVKGGPGVGVGEPHQPVEKRHSEPAMTAASLAGVTGVSPPQEDTKVHDSPSRTCIKSACDSMRYQILSRAFYGWLAHCRHIQTIRTHLSCLVFKVPVEEGSERGPLTLDTWSEFRLEPSSENESEFYRLVYLGGVSPELRREVWPYLLGFVAWEESLGDGVEPCRRSYDSMIMEWMAVEAIVRQRDKELFQAAREWQDTGSEGCHGDGDSLSGRDSAASGEVFGETQATPREGEEGEEGEEEEDGETPRAGDGREWTGAEEAWTREATQTRPAPCPSGRSTPEEGEGGIYSKELIDTFALNLHRIEKDVHRCDRNYPYFTNENLEKLKNVMCTYVWEHLDSGYVQGMCDLAAPLLVIFDDEMLTYGCFSKLMERMMANFPHGGGMDMHLANMRSLIQVMDPELFDLMHRNGDYTHFYFCYRWFLLDFKRELVYDDVFLAWEVIWAALRVSSGHFVLFLALGFLMVYREIILDNNMDFTDIIKFFNEMAEKHDAQATLKMARNQIRRLQLLIQTNSS